MQKSQDGTHYLKSRQISDILSKISLEEPDSQPKCGKRIWTETQSEHRACHTELHKGLKCYSGLKPKGKLHSQNGVNLKEKVEILTRPLK